jgi:23S rRNA (cytosine1962-C5)-methyltransferase
MRPGSVELVDFGDAARLERFGDRLVDRPHPGALTARRAPDRWAEADIRFDREGGWSGSAIGLEAWPVEVDGLTMQLRPTDAGQVGLFPEHAEMLPWLRERVHHLSAGDADQPSVLHLFAYTGLVTLGLVRDGATVTHVDASRPTVAWARRNAELAELSDRPIRWIVDDARRFTEREARRGRRYAGVVLDPPTYGHGADGRPWRIEEDLEPLMAVCAMVLEPGGFVLLTAHTPSLGPDGLGAILLRTMRLSRASLYVGMLGLTTSDGRRMELGSFARVAGTA